MKRLKIIIIVAVLICFIFGLIFAINTFIDYRNRKYYEQSALEFKNMEEERQKEIDLLLKERINEYKIIEQIGLEYFEDNLTSIELENRKRQAIKEMPGKKYKLFVKLSDIKLESGQRVVIFTHTLIHILYRPPVKAIFYDNNKLVNNHRQRRWLEYGL